MVCRKVLIHHVKHTIGFSFPPGKRLINVLERAIELGNEGRRATGIDIRRYGYTDSITIRASQLIVDYQLETFIEIDEDIIHYDEIGGGIPYE